MSTVTEAPSPAERAPIDAEHGLGVDPPPTAPGPADGDAGGSKRNEKPPPLSPRLGLIRAALVTVFALAAGMVVHLLVTSSLHQRAEQQRLYDSFRGDLAKGTAPVGPTVQREGDDDTFEAVPVSVGDPVAYLEIPELDLQQVVVSGTTSGALVSGPGHRRDTVLPGQAGASVFMGRRSAYGGPFAAIDSLEEGDLIEITTGQSGDDPFEYRVLGVRRDGDPLPAPPGEGESRLILVTADGPPYLPDGVVRVDAELEGTADPGPGRLFSRVPAAESNMAGDTSQLWALALWLQALTAVSLATVWAWHRWGRAQTWVVFLPVLLLVGLFVANQTSRLLPNLL